MFWWGLVAAMAITSSVVAMEVIGDPLNIPKEETGFDARPLSTERRCMSPWVSIGNKEGCFLFIQDQMNWDNARSYCQRKEGDLIIIDTESKRKDLIKYMEIHGLRDGHGRHLGANDRAGYWRWLNGRSVTNGWRKLKEVGQAVEPDDDQGNDTCMYLYTASYPAGRYDLLSDYKCTNEKYFICEKMVTTTKSTTTNENWSGMKSACISGNNYKSLTEVPTIGGCKEKCTSETGTLCMSIYYNPSSHACNLQEVRSDSSDYMEPCRTRGWLYSERNIEDAYITRTTTSTLQITQTTETIKNTTSTLQSYSTSENAVTSTPQNITDIGKSTTKAAACISTKDKTTTKTSTKTKDIFGADSLFVNPCSFSTEQKYWAHPTNCHRYIECTPYGPREMLCPNGTAWSTTLFFCIHKVNTDCRQKVPLTPIKKIDPPCQCGVVNRQRIIGGENITLARKYPWQVGLKYKGLDHTLCGGSIINDRWILTAAHCIKSPYGSATFMFGDDNPLTVVVGEHIQNDLGDDKPCVTKNYRIKQYILHPDYVIESLYNDFALLELVEPIPFDDEIRPICLPQDKYEDYTGETGTVIGWGKTSNEDGSESDILKELQVQIRGNNDCRRWHEAFNSTTLPSIYLCAVGHSSGSNICSRDSGGPLFIFDKNKARYVQVGVASFVSLTPSGVIDCDNPDYPGVYARVSEERKWITETTYNGNKCN